MWGPTVPFSKLHHHCSGPNAELLRRQVRSLCTCQAYACCAVLLMCPALKLLNAGRASTYIPIFRLYTLHCTVWFCQRTPPVGGTAQKTVLGVLYGAWGAEYLGTRGFKRVRRGRPRPAVAPGPANAFVHRSRPIRLLLHS